MQPIFKGEQFLKTSHSFEGDEFGNVIQTSVYVYRGNKIENILSPPQLPSMASDDQREILSRSMVFDDAAQLTTLEERRIRSYGPASRKRLSIDANSGTENVTAHPRFQDLAGTPDEPDEDNAIWIESNDTGSTKRFVEFKKESIKGVTSYIAGNGSTLKVTYIDTWGAFGMLVNDIGKIAFPEVDIWGTSTSWLLAGATAEPFGNRWKISLLYRNASANFGQYNGDGWATQIYS